MLENLEKHALYKILSLLGLLIGIVFGIVKLKQELMPSHPATPPMANASSPATPADGPQPPFTSPAKASNTQETPHLQNQIYIDLDNFQIGKQYIGKSIEMPIIFDGFTPWLGGIAGAATGSLSKRYLFLSHYDINSPNPPYGMLSSQTIVVPIDKANALRELKVPARIMLTGNVKAIDVMKEMGAAKKFSPDALIFEVESFKAL